MDSAEKLQFQILACKARMGAIIGTFNAKSGHPGGSLSAADIYTYLYFKEMNVDVPFVEPNALSPFAWNVPCVSVRLPS